MFLLFFNMSIKGHDFHIVGSVLKFSVFLRLQWKKLSIRSSVCVEWIDRKVCQRWPDFLFGSVYRPSALEFSCNFFVQDNQSWIMDYLQFIVGKPWLHADLTCDVFERHKCLNWIELNVNNVVSAFALAVCFVGAANTPQGFERTVPWEELRSLFRTLRSTTQQRELRHEAASTQSKSVAVGVCFIALVHSSKVCASREFPGCFSFCTSVS